MKGRGRLGGPAAPRFTDFRSLWHWLSAGPQPPASLGTMSLSVASRPPTGDRVATRRNLAGSRSAWTDRLRERRELLPDDRSRSVRHGTRMIDVRGLKLNVREAGPEGRPLLILLHGFGIVACWRKVMRPLGERGFHVVAPDMRGYGEAISQEAPKPTASTSLLRT